MSRPKVKAVWALEADFQGPGVGHRAVTGPWTTTSRDQVQPGRQGQPHNPPEKRVLGGQPFGSVFLAQAVYKGRTNPPHPNFLVPFPRVKFLVPGAVTTLVRQAIAIEFPYYTPT